MLCVRYDNCKKAKIERFQETKSISRNGERTDAGACAYIHLSAARHKSVNPTRTLLPSPSKVFHPGSIKLAR